MPPAFKKLPCWSKFIPKSSSIAQAMKMPFRKRTGLNNWSAINPLWSLAWFFFNGCFLLIKQSENPFSESQLLNKKKSQMVSNYSNMTKNNLRGKVVKRECDWLEYQRPVGGKGCLLQLRSKQSKNLRLHPFHACRRKMQRSLIPEISLCQNLFQ